MHAANRRIYGQWTSSIPSRFIAELPAEHVEVETSMSGGASLWRSQFSEQPDPFAHAGRGAGRGPGWQRASGGGFNRASGTRIIAATARAVSLGSAGRGDSAGGDRGFHDQFGTRHREQFTSKQREKL